MDLNVYLTYIMAVMLLTMTPGPSIFLGMVHSMNYGIRRTLYTALGDISANFLQMMLVAIGLGAVVAASETAFLAVKWFGVITLAWLGLKMFFTPVKNDILADVSAQPLKSRRHLYMQGFLVAAGNPKAIVFFTAFFPQFIDPNRNLIPQLAIMCPTMTLLDFFWVMTYSASASRMLGTLRRHPRVINRVGGSVLVGAAAFLAFSRRQLN